MIVAVVAVGVVQVAVDQVVDVVAVGHGFVATPRTVHVVGGVTPARMRRRAAIGVRRVDGDGVFVDVIVVGMMEVTIVEVVDVTVVKDACVAAARTMDVLVVGVDGAIATLRHSEGTPVSLTDETVGQRVSARRPPQGREPDGGRGARVQLRQTLLTQWLETLP